MIENYLNEDAKVLFERFATDADREWVWRFLAILKKRYPAADHWTTGGKNKSYIDLRIGKKTQGKSSGWPVLFCRIDSDKKPLFFLHNDVIEKSKSYQPISRKESRTDAEINEWLDKYQKLILKEKNAYLMGKGLNPVDYAAADNEVDPEMTASLVEAGGAKNSSVQLNQILYGPPGTGKTFATIDAALEILDSDFLNKNRDDRAALKQRYDQLVENGLVRFVTFHQSFSYEDFVEGLRASNGENGQIKYDVEDGVFKTICESAVARVTQQVDASIDLAGRRIWKMSLGNTKGDDSYIYDECIEGNIALLGYGNVVDFTGAKSPDDIVQRFHAAGKQVAADAYAVSAVSIFVLKIQQGDLLIITDGNHKFRAIGEVTGDYQFIERDDGYRQARPVRWLRVYSPSLPYQQLTKKQFSQMTLYLLKPNTIDNDKLRGLLSNADIVPSIAGLPFYVGQQFGQGYTVTNVSPDIVELKKPKGGQLPLPLTIIRQLIALVKEGRITLDDIRQRHVFEKVNDTALEKYIVNGYESVIAALVEIGLIDPLSKVPSTNARVLIIDEINRGNTSRIFGELITLIEPSKRSGAPEALEVTLPYSKDSFSVPSNVYIVGTMNTADRSLAGLDIALRRRFAFKEMPPRPELLESVLVEGVNVGELLGVMNQRIEVLLDRDHCLGQAYFMPLLDDPSLMRLGAIFRNQIIPLLQEYFFEDWQRIQWVLNDHRKAAEDCFLIQPNIDQEKLFGDGIEISGRGTRWSINESTFERASAYCGVIKAGQ